MTKKAKDMKNWYRKLTLPLFAVFINLSIQLGQEKIRNKNKPIIKQRYRKRQTISDKGS